MQTKLFFIPRPRPRCPLANQNIPIPRPMSALPVKPQTQQTRLMVQRLVHHCVRCRPAVMQSLGLTYAFLACNEGLPFMAAASAPLTRSLCDCTGDQLANTTSGNDPSEVPTARPNHQKTKEPPKPLIAYHCVLRCVVSVVLVSACVCVFVLVCVCLCVGWWLVYSTTTKNVFV